MKRDFKGIWIPKEIWLIQELKPVYRVFLAEIDSLDNGEGCYAENEHFAKMFGLSVNRCSEIITMLKNDGYVTATYDGINPKASRRKLFVNVSIEKSISKSKNRLSQSKNRLSQSKNRFPIYKEEKQIEKQERDNALDFLKKYSPAEYESFLMQYKKQIKDFEKFELDFNDTVDVEQLNYDVKVLMGRLGRYARNWIQNQDRFKVIKNEPEKPNYLKNYSA